VARALLQDFRARGGELPPAPSAARLKEMMTFSTAEPVSDTFCEMLLEETNFVNRDRQWQGRIEQVLARKAPDGFSVIVVGAGMSGLCSGIKLKGDQSLNVKTLMLGRVGIAAALVGLASLEVLRRDRRSLGLLGRALATGVPLAIIAGGLFLGRDALAAQQAVPAWIVWTLVSIGVVVAMALLCACGHFVIRAFEMGRPESATSKPATETAGPTPAAS
jgi:hypothetical protein